MTSADTIAAYKREIGQYQDHLRAMARSFAETTYEEFMKQEGNNMNKTIWKYEITDHQVIEMPIGAEILMVQKQRGEPCMWALVDPTKPKENRVFRVFGTGESIPYDMCKCGNYLGTYQLYQGAYVFHVFEYM